MKDKEELIGDINKSQASIDSLIQELNRARQKLIEIRTKVDNNQLRPGKLSQILDELIASLSPKAEQEIQEIIEDLRGLQGELAVK